MEIEVVDAFPTTPFKACFFGIGGIGGIAIVCCILPPNAFNNGVFANVFTVAAVAVAAAAFAFAFAAGIGGSLLFKSTTSKHFPGTNPHTAPLPNGVAY
jgi:hypothetical protein